MWYSSYAMFWGEYSILYKIITIFGSYCRRNNITKLVYTTDEAELKELCHEFLYVFFLHEPNLY